MTQDIHLGGRARELVDRLREDWIGESWDDVVIDDVQLLSAPDRWPPVIQLDYQVAGKPGRWVDPWDDDVLRDDSLEMASGLWQSIVAAHLMDYAQPPPQHTRR